PQARREPTPDDEAAGTAGPSHLEETQVIPVVTGEEPVAEAPADRALEPADGHHAPAEEPVVDEPVVEEPVVDHEPVGPADPSHLDETQVIPVVTEEEPVVEAPVDNAPSPVDEH